MNMPRVTIGFGGALVVLGLVGYAGTGGESWTALIPAFFGFVLVALGLVAVTEGLRHHAMHVAVVVGLLGFLGSVSAIPGLLRLMAGGEVAGSEAAVIARSVMALVTGVYVVLCVKSFVDARRRRTAAGSM